jgi:Tol biopolymer transport system component
VTAFDRFDPFERRISEAVDEIAATRRPDYLDDIFRLTARTAQRPRWTFLERWLSVDTTLTRPRLVRIPLRPLLVLALIALLAATIAFVAGSRQRVPPPFGPAGNGTLAYSFGGDLFVRDSLTGQSRLLVGSMGKEAFPSYSPDGQWLAYVDTIGTVDHFIVSSVNGTAVTQELATFPPAPSNAQAAWRPDSHAFAFIYDIAGIPQLSIAPVDGSPAVQIDLGGLRPLDVSWRPPSGAQLLIRAHGAGEEVGLYTLNPDGTGLKDFNLPGHSDFGLDYTLSGSTWSPDGGTIAYNSVEPIPGAGPFMSHFRIRLINADASGDRAVAGPNDPTVQEAWPVYSPDGRWIVVHRWILKADNPNAEGWLAVMPSDGSAPARDIGPRILGGEETGLSKVWSPDGTRLLMRSYNTKQTFSIDPVSGTYETLVWTSELPDWQRVAR